MKAALATKTFIENVRPYQGRFVIKTNEKDMFGETIWKTVDGRLHAKQIGAAIFGKITLGFFSQYSAWSVCIDIDAHDIKGRKYTLSTELQIRYAEAVKLMNCFPSLLFQSPRGLHAYWLLTNPIPDKVIQMSLSEKQGQLHRIFAEPKGTSNNALRLPNHERQIDPVTLRKIDVDFNGVKYNPVELLNESPATIRESLTRSQTIFKSTRLFSQLEAIEKNHCFMSGFSNETYKKLAGVYFAKGLTQPEALERMRIKLFSDGYKGELLNREKLNVRLSATWRNLKRRGVTHDIKSSLTFEDLKLIEILTEKHPFSRQRTKPVRAFLEKLFYWLNWHDLLWKENQSEVTLLSWMYAGYRKYRRLGLYPLPWALMEKWNDRAHEIVSWLKEDGIIKDPKTPYFFISNNMSLNNRLNPNRLNSCKFYEIRRLTEARQIDNGFEALLALSQTMTQKEIASRLCVTPGAVSRWLSGERTMPEHKLTEVRVMNNNIDLPSKPVNRGKLCL